MMRQKWYIWFNRAQENVVRLFMEDEGLHIPSDSRYCLGGHCGTHTRLHQS